MTTVRRQRFQIIFFIITSGLRKRSYRRLETRLVSHSSACHECIGLGYVFMDPLRSVIYHLA